MAWIIVLGLTALPVVEIMVWIRLADLIGGLATIALTIGSVAMGLAILRRQGLALLLEVQASIRRGEPPMAVLVDGFALSLAGVLLVVPGFVTDVAALLLLLPPLRKFLVRRVAGKATPAGPVVIEGDYQIIPPDTKRLEP